MVQVHPRNVAERQAGLEHTRAARRRETAMLSLTQLLASSGGNLCYKQQTLPLHQWVSRVLTLSMPWAGTVVNKTQQKLLLQTKTDEQLYKEFNRTWNKLLQISMYKSKAEGKGVPWQAQCGPEGSRRFRLPDFMTFGTWRWWGCQPHAPAAFTPRNVPGTHFQ